MEELHDYLFDIFYAWHYQNKNFKFRTRKTNRSGRLDSKYWFIGNDHYLAVGFWEGNDWKRKLPYISFLVHKDGSHSLYFTASESTEVAKFICEKIFPEIDIELDYKQFEKQKFEYHYIFSSNELVQSLNHFHGTIWKKIDQHIVQQDHLELREIEDSIMELDIEKILRYRNENRISIAYRVKKILIANYGPISIGHLDNIPKDTHFIFLTGENGTGKSSVLKAIATAITGREITEKETYISKAADMISYFQTSMFFHSDKIMDMHLSRMGNNIPYEDVYTTGYAAYGPVRLNSMSSEMTDSELGVAISKSNINSSLFEEGGYLLDLESQFASWFNAEDKQAYAGLSFAIKEFLENVLLNVGKIEFEVNDKNVLQTVIYEQDEDGNLFEPVSLSKLSSGYKSILNMMGDMIVRLLNQQPDCNDLAELTGLVIIDEIDIHLHPKFQKFLVEQLAATFPKIQFIVTTHSPIPLLGAPKNSVVCVVKRNKEKGTFIERVDDQLLLENMLPNSILSSPVFGFKELFPVSHDEDKKIRTENSFEEIKKNDELKAYLKSIAQNLKSKG